MTIKETEVVIEAKHEMPDWEVREFHMIPIYFKDHKFHLVGKRKAQPPFAFRYVLQLWPEGHVQNPKLFHTYDADAVAEREAARRSRMCDVVVRCCLLPLYPVLGFLWSGIQRRLARFGFVPRSITGVSIFMSFCLLFTQGVFAVILINASTRSGKMMAGGMIRALTSVDHIHIGRVSISVLTMDCLLFVALLADVLMRYGHYLRDDDWEGGFLEWLVPKFPRRKK